MKQATSERLLAPLSYLGSTFSPLGPWTTEHNRHEEQLAAVLETGPGL